MKKVRTHGICNVSVRRIADSIQLRWIADQGEQRPQETPKENSEGYRARCAYDFISQNIFTQPGQPRGFSIHTGIPALGAPASFPFERFAFLLESPSVCYQLMPGVCLIAVCLVAGVAWAPGRFLLPNTPLPFS